MYIKLFIINRNAAEGPIVTSAVLTYKRIQVKNLNSRPPAGFTSHVCGAIDGAIRPCAPLLHFAAAHRPLDSLERLLKHGDWAHSPCGFGDVRLDGALRVMRHDGAGTLSVHQMPICVLRPTGEQRDEGNLPP